MIIKAGSALCNIARILQSFKVMAPYLILDHTGVLLIKFSLHFKSSAPITERTSLEEVSSSRLALDGVTPKVYGRASEKSAASRYIIFGQIDILHSANWNNGLYKLCWNWSELIIFQKPENNETLSMAFVKLPYVIVCELCMQRPEALGPVRMGLKNKDTCLSTKNTTYTPPWQAGHSGWVPENGTSRKGPQISSFLS